MNFPSGGVHSSECLVRYKLLPGRPCSARATHLLMVGFEPVLLIDRMVPATDTLSCLSRTPTCPQHGGGYYICSGWDFTFHSVITTQKARGATRNMRSQRTGSHVEHVHETVSTFNTLASCGQLHSCISLSFHLCDPSTRQEHHKGNRTTLAHSFRRYRSTMAQKA